ncbi:hypothetical protein AGR13a_Cc90039 [Agrobacterium genomosp. 13 str. CFBP 6927]|uniref:Uncharacterized protein n=1 Tax=Agrobacterium genomosp. 13 str. CFBP 6927 TaxID=1183428 RepID=A0ABM9VIJ5_9HYPH|nr:hypothetical protein AGR13a_Cc90039 [Agrobacterium genomosp. 13 str. CFBP 6927]
MLYLSWLGSREIAKDLAITH